MSLECALKRVECWDKSFSKLRFGARPLLCMARKLIFFEIYKIGPRSLPTLQILLLFLYCFFELLPELFERQFSCLIFFFRHKFFIRRAHMSHHCTQKNTAVNF